MKNRSVLALAFIGVTAGSAASWSIKSYNSGTSCHPPSPASQYISWNDGWISNGSSSSNWVICPMNWTPSSVEKYDFTAYSTIVSYRDRSSSASVSCYQYGRSRTNTTYSGGVKYSCATNGGCSTDSSPSSTTNYSGTDYYLEFGEFGVDNAASIAIDCVIPGMSGSPSVASFIMGYHFVYESEY